MALALDKCGSCSGCCTVHIQRIGSSSTRGPGRTHLWCTSYRAHGKRQVAKASDSTAKTARGSLSLRGSNDRSFENLREGHGEMSRLSLQYVSSGSAVMYAVEAL
ncbi:hypothetical protein V6N13_047879 [Hibiscus sabdariffa]|uniref:Uncharacterized protein n=1 Tax=Hibiscus sabdariffa TaxID=183260 RepID=A0ABR2F5I1_9ROSI